MGLGRDGALASIMTLGPPPYVADEASAETWRNLARESARSADSYFNTLAGWLKEVGCSAAGAPYVISSLLRQGPENDGTMQLEVGFQRGHPAQEAEVATAFLDETKCPGARGLSEENKVKLQQIRSRTLSAPPGPGAAAPYSSRAQAFNFFLLDLIDGGRQAAELLISSVFPSLLCEPNRTILWWRRRCRC
jgi:hypothetical protein